MTSTPASKITIFDMGNLSGSGDFQLELSILAKERARITHNALEAARIAANRHLAKNAGKAAYYLKFRLYPHEVLRENKQATGAGADRVSDGMRRAFGKARGLAAKVEKGQKILSVRVNLPHYEVAKRSLKKAAAKLPIPCKISIDKGRELLKF